MPEIHFIKQKDGFISIWEMNEPSSFLKSAVELPLLHVLEKENYSEKRMVEKLLPHFVLKKHNIESALNNTDRKPTMSSGYISISHSKNLLAIYYTTYGPIGVDIEHKGARVMKILKKFMNPTELESFSNDDTKALVVWAAKESLFKKHGGDAAFFAENLWIKPFDTIKNHFSLDAQVKHERTTMNEVLNCELFDEFVLVYTT